MADYGKPRRRQVDPLLAVAAEAAGASLRGADYVVEGLSEGLRRRTRSRSAGRAAGRQRAAQARSSGGTTPPDYEGPPPPVTGGTADLFVELLDRFGEAVQDIAATIADRESYDGEPECPTLKLRGVPGQSPTVEFDFTNTGPRVLAKVAFEATHLLGATTRIDARKVSFKHGTRKVNFKRGKDAHIPRVAPGGRARVIVEVTIPEKTPEGDYRGLVAARSAPPDARAETEGGPHDAWTLIELEVRATDPHSPITPLEHPQEA